SSKTATVSIICENSTRKYCRKLKQHLVRSRETRRTSTSPRRRKLAWLAALRLKHHPKTVYVCSFHFIDPERKLTRTTLSVTASNSTVLRSVELDEANISTQPPEPHLHSVPTQWEDPPQQDHQYCNRSRRKDVQDKMTQCDEVAYFILQNDADPLLYTGIALETFNTLVSTLEGYDNNEFTMPVRDQVLMTLMKLKSNRVIGDLSRQFHISQSMASKIISHWLDKLEAVLQPLIPWLPKETIQTTMPEAFKKNFPNTTCIIDCSETLLQKPRNLGSRGESCSHYYSHNTVKYLVAVA
uniref:Transposase Helix-turn-helix domain-containing protein n=1 Tax=Haplochromis burtoni TaxID=8153 RepID=A0A3Q3BUY7_HAPBU